MSPNTPNDFSPPPAPTSPSESVAAPAEVGQGLGTPSSQKPTCRRGTCPAGRLCLACEAPIDLSSLSDDASPTLEQFELWLESEAHTSAVAISETYPRYSSSRDLYLDHALVIAECRVAIKLLMQFKFEVGA